MQEFDFVTALKDCKRTQAEISGLVLKEVDGNNEVLGFIKKYFDFCLDTNHITSTSTKFNIEKLNQNDYSSIINLKKVNDARYLETSWTSAI